MPAIQEENAQSLYRFVARMTEILRRHEREEEEE
jgi:hypothetical protein